MCGLAGSFAADVDVNTMLDRIAHRGPDGRGLVRCGRVQHGHVRLALLDLTDASAQPFRYRDGVLSYNGELWNYRALRDRLQPKGYTFTTTGDTEVVAAALHCWGIAAVEEFDGMFAFAWSRGDEHWLARDRYGKVPLYVLTGFGVSWASERKAWPAPEAGRARLLPAGTLYHLPTQTEHRWASVPEQAGMDPAPAVVRAWLAAAVRKRFQADAPVCCLISGGLDSSLVLALAKEAGVPGLTAYTAVHDPASLDRVAAQEICSVLGVPLREVLLPAVTVEALRDAVYTVETPMKAQIEIGVLADPLAAAVARDGFKACLSGEGADELFGGYGAMCIASRRLDDAGWRALRADQVRKMARANLLRCNKVFLAHGVECRVPYLDRTLVEGVLAASKRACPAGKALLKAAAGGLLPPSIIRRVKQTFQGGAGIIDAAQRALVGTTPQRAYNAWARSLFGTLIHD